MKTVEIPGLGVVEFPDGMSDEAITAKAAELSRSAAPAPPSAPSAHPWVQVNEAARQGLMPTGEPIGQAAAVGATDLAATGLRLGPPLVASAAPMIAGPVAAGSEAAAQGFEMATGARETFDPTAVGVAGAIPPAMAGAGALLRAGARRLPGAAATLHDMAKQSLERLATIFGPAQSSDALYAMVRQQNPPVALPRLAAASKKLLSEEQLAASGLELTTVARTAGDFRKVSELPFDQAHLNLKRLGGKVRETRLDGGEEHGAWKLLWREGMKDLEAAAAAGSDAMPAVRALKQANAAARREYVAEEIADIFSKGGLTARPDLGPDAFAVNFGRIANDLRKGKYAADIKAVLKPEEYTELLQHVSDLARQTPNLPPPRGQFAGSAVRLGQVAGGAAAGYLAAPALGMDRDTAMAVGVIAGSKGVDILTRAMMSETGRQTLSYVLAQTGGIVTDKVLSLLALAAAQTPAARSGAMQLGDLGRGAFGGQP